MTSHIEEVAANISPVIMTLNFPAAFINFDLVLFLGIRDVGTVLKPRKLGSGNPTRRRTLQDDFSASCSRDRRTRSPSDPLKGLS